MYKTRIKKNRNEVTGDRLDTFWNELSDRAKRRIEETDFQVIDDLFGKVESAEDMNKLADDFLEIEIWEVWDQIVNLMDDEIREEIHNDYAPCPYITFLEKYLEKDPDFEEVLKIDFNIRL